MWDACMSIFNDANQCGDWCTTEICFSVPRLINEGSDGWVYSGSQKGDNSNWGGDVVVIDELNHSEMWFHDDLQDNLENIFDGVNSQVSNNTNFFIVPR